MEPLVKPIEGVSAAQNRIFRRAEGRDDVETALKAGERIDDLQRDGLRIIQREDGFRFGTDAVLLAGTGLGACLEAPETRAKRFRMFLYESSPTFLERNADLSAEGALVQAMGRTGDALPDMTVLVTGYGRFGRALAAKLKTLGADVWVAARREEQRLAARSDGMRAASLAELPALMGRVDMVLNTIPARVLGTEALAALPKGA